MFEVSKKKKKSVRYHISNNTFSKLKNHHLCSVQEVEYKFCACDFFQMGTYYTIMYCQHPSPSQKKKKKNVLSTSCGIDGFQDN